MAWQTIHSQAPTPEPKSRLDRGTLLFVKFALGLTIFVATAIVVGLVFPIVILAAFAGLMVAWVAPTTVRRFLAHSSMQVIPERVRTTPMRFALLTTAFLVPFALLSGIIIYGAILDADTLGGASEPSVVPTATSEPVWVTEEEAYIAEVRDQSLNMLERLEHLEGLLYFPEISSESWRAAVVGTVYSISYHPVVDMENAPQPPQGFTDVHSLYLEGMALCSEIRDDLYPEDGTVDILAALQKNHEAQKVLNQVVAELDELP